MKLLFVHERWGAFGGAEANLHLAARELKNRGHAVGLLHGPPTGQGEMAWREVFPALFPLHPNGELAAENALQEFGPEVVYVHKMQDLKVLETLLASGLPLVRMVHDHDLYCMRSYKYHVFSRAVCARPASPYCIFPCGASVARNRQGGFPLKWVSYASKKKEIRLNQRFDRLLVATDYMKRELLRNGFEEEKIEIHAPITQNPGAAEAAREPSERNLILYVGQIIRGKGVDVLLESLSQIQTPFECLIIGEGNHRAHCEKLSQRLGLADRVHFPGFIAQEKLPRYFRQAAVLALSSVWPEPFGGAGLEAMRYSLPVVAFDAGGIREWLISGYNGFLVPWMNRAQFATRLEELLLNKTLARQLGERGARLLAQRFSFSEYITGLENTFNGLCSQPEERVRVSA